MAATYQRLGWRFLRCTLFIVSLKLNLRFLDFNLFGQNFVLDDPVRVYIRFVLKKLLVGFQFLMLRVKCPESMPKPASLVFKSADLGSLDATSVAGTTRTLLTAFSI